MVAIEATIIATAVPLIVGEIGGFAYYSWAFSAFLLSLTSTTIIYGKLADIFGRRPVMVTGMIVFTAASILCGLAWSMTSLIAFRFIQGLGAGAILPVATTIVGDLYSIEERGKVQAAISSVWAIAASLGPLLGAAIVERFSWSWIFWINVPLGIAAVSGLLLTFREEPPLERRPVDIAGAFLFFVTMLALLVAIAQIGGSLPLALAFGLLFLVSAATFAWQERRTPEPILSFSLWSRRLVATCNLTTLMAGFSLIGVTTMLPLYVQGVMGGSPLMAGMALTMLAIGWPLASALSGRWFKRYGIVPTVRIGSLAFPLGAVILFFMAPGHPVAVAALGSFVMGFGMGIINIGCIVLVQNSVEWSMRGSATSSNLFARSLGNTLGAAMLGAILNFGIVHFASPGLAEQLAEALEVQGGLSRVSSDLSLAPILGAALNATFAAVALLATAAVLAAWLIPRNPDLPGQVRTGRPRD